jgi:hypothetical protein
MNVEKDDDQGAGDAQAGCQPEQSKSPRKKRPKNMERDLKRIYQIQEGDGRENTKSICRDGN